MDKYVVSQAIEINIHLQGKGQVLLKPKDQVESSSIGSQFQ